MFQFCKKKKKAIMLRNQGKMFMKCVIIFPNTESSNNKHGLIATVNSKNWLYPVLLGDKLRNIFVTQIS